MSVCVSMFICVCTCIYEEEKSLLKTFTVKFPLVYFFNILTENIITCLNLHLFIFKLCVQFTIGPEPNAEE